MYPFRVLFSVPFDLWKMDHDNELDTGNREWLIRRKVEEKAHSRGRGVMKTYIRLRVSLIPGTPSWGFLILFNDMVVVTPTPRHRVYTP